MLIARRLFAPVAIQDPQNRVVSVNLSALVLRLFLFDTCIIQSIWLEDLILLQHSFGTAGLAQLFESGALGFLCPVFTFGQTGQARPIFTPEHSRQPLPPLPFFQYQFSEVRVQGAEEKLDRTMAGLDSALRAELVKGRVAVPPEYSKTVFDGFYRDLRSELLDSAVRIELRRMGIIPVPHHLHAEQKEDDQFAVDTDLPRRYQLPPAEAHRVIESAMMAVGRTDDRIASTQAYRALTGLSESDKALLDAKLGAVAGLAEPRVREEQFSRVISLKGLPVPEYGSSVVDVKQLLKVRESDECRTFKDWLAASAGFSDKELRERVSGLSYRIRQAVHSRTGKAVRLLVSTGIGAVAGLASPIAGLATGIAQTVADSFILEKLLPKDSVISFLTDGYAPVFKPSRKG